MNREKHKSIEFWDRPENKSFNLDKLPCCSFKDCNLHLILSNQFNCLKCKNLYCSEHIILFNHNCSSLLENINNKEIPELIIHPKCSLSSCNIKMDLCNRFKCEKCVKLYCMSHRHDFSHNCSS